MIALLIVILALLILGSASLLLFGNGSVFPFFDAAPGIPEK